MSLRIPLAVTRCPPGPGHDRVRYQYQDRCLTPEGVVLRRWRDRSLAPSAIQSRTVFDGCRLPPGTWRIVHACIGRGLAHGDVIDEEELRRHVTAVRIEHPTWRAPQTTKLAALIQFLSGRRVLEKVLSATRDDRSPGIPDLFVYRVNAAKGVHDGRFIEVKRHVRSTGDKERISRAQRREHQLLRSLKLRVSVVYLLE